MKWKTLKPLNKSEKVLYLKRIRNARVAYVHRVPDTLLEMCNLYLSARYRTLWRFSNFGNLVETFSAAASNNNNNIYFIGRRSFGRAVPQTVLADGNIITAFAKIVFPSSGSHKMSDPRLRKIFRSTRNRCHFQLSVFKSFRSAFATRIFDANRLLWRLITGYSNF